MALGFGARVAGSTVKQKWLRAVRLVGMLRFQGPLKPFPIPMQIVLAEVGRLFSCFCEVVGSSIGFRASVLG